MWKKKKNNHKILYCILIKEEKNKLFKYHFNDFPQLRAEQT